MAVSIIPVVRRDLQEFVEYWNTHHIRSSSRAFCPSGRPDDMFDMPQIYGNYLFTGVLVFAFVTLMNKFFSLYNHPYLNYIIGGEACLQTLNRRILNFGKERAKQPATPYDDNFFYTCNTLVNHVFGIDVNNASHNNCIEIYKYLVNITNFYVNFISCDKIIILWMMITCEKFNISECNKLACRSGTVPQINYVEYILVHAVMHSYLIHGDSILIASLCGASDDCLKGLEACQLHFTCCFVSHSFEGAL